MIDFLQILGVNWASTAGVHHVNVYVSDLCQNGNNIFTKYYTESQLMSLLFLLPNIMLHCTPLEIIIFHIDSVGFLPHILPHL